MTKTWAETTRERLAHIKVLGLDELRKLPQAQPFDAGLYFLWEGEDLVYVGKSTNILERAERQFRINRCHSLYLDRHQPIPHDRQTCLVLGSGRFRDRQLEFQLRDYERAYIAHYEPRYNHLDQNGGT